MIDSYNGSITLDDAQQLCASEKNEERQCSASHIDWDMIDPNGDRLQGKGTVFNTKLDWDDFRKNSHPFWAYYMLQHSLRTKLVLVRNQVS